MYVHFPNQWHKFKLRCKRDNLLQVVCSVEEPLRSDVHMKSTLRGRLLYICTRFEQKRRMSKNLKIIWTLYVQICRKICGLGCVTRTLVHAWLTQPSPRIFLHICTTHSCWTLCPRTRYRKRRTGRSRTHWGIRWCMRRVLNEGYTTDPCLL